MHTLVLLLRPTHGIRDHELEVETEQQNGRPRVGMSKEAAASKEANESEDGWLTEEEVQRRVASIPDSAIRQTFIFGDELTPGPSDPSTPSQESTSTNSSVDKNHPRISPRSPLHTQRRSLHNHAFALPRPPKPDNIRPGRLQWDNRVLDDHILSHLRGQLLERAPELPASDLSAWPGTIVLVNPGNGGLASRLIASGLQRLILLESCPDAADDWRRYIASNRDAINMRSIKVVDTNDSSQDLSNQPETMSALRESLGEEERVGWEALDTAGSNPSPLPRLLFIGTPSLSLAQEKRVLHRQTLSGLPFQRDLFSWGPAETLYFWSPVWEPQLGLDLSRGLAVRSSVTRDIVPGLRRLFFRDAIVCAARFDRFSPPWSSTWSSKEQAAFAKVRFSQEHYALLVHSQPRPLPPSLPRHQLALFVFVRNLIAQHQRDKSDNSTLAAVLRQFFGQDLSLDPPLRAFVERPLKELSSADFQRIFPLFSGWLSECGEEERRLDALSHELEVWTGRHAYFVTEPGFDQLPLWAEQALAQTDTGDEEEAGEEDEAGEEEETGEEGELEVEELEEVPHVERAD